MKSKKHLAPLLFLMLMVWYACPLKDSGSTQFLVGSKGNNDGLEYGLYLYKLGSTPEFITNLAPWNFDMGQIDQNNGVIAYRINRDQTPEGTSGIAFMDSDDLHGISYAPIPSAPEGYYYSIPSEAPRVLPDGRIAYRITYETDNIYDDYHVGMLAIYNPSNGDVEISGDPSGFVLGQPEQGGDTEGGSMGSGFLFSPDGKYAYCQLYGYGTDWGVYHVDYKFIVQYTIGSPGYYERLQQVDGTVAGVTGDGTYLMVNSGEGLMKIDIAAKSMTKADIYTNYFYPGQASKSTNKMFKSWRGSGLGEFTIGSAVDFIQIIQGDKITNSSYRGLNHRSQYNHSEDRIIFTGSTDYYTNYATDLIIFETPIVELNETPDSIGHLSAEYCTNMFLLLD